MNNSKLDIKIHPKEGLMMTIIFTPWLLFCAGAAILLCAVSAVALAVVPLVEVVIHAMRSNYRKLEISSDMVRFFLVRTVSSDTCDKVVVRCWS